MERLHVVVDAVVMGMWLVHGKCVGDAIKSCGVRAGKLCLRRSFVDKPSKQ